MWPGEEEPALANIIKVVHFGWHHVSSTMGHPKGWEGQIRNKVRVGPRCSGLRGHSSRRMAI